MAPAAEGILAFNIPDAGGVGDGTALCDSRAHQPAEAIVDLPETAEHIVRGHESTSHDHQRGFRAIHKARRHP